jgi:hypothetical protein
MCLWSRWFEIFECTRRLLLSAAVVLIYPGSVNQIVISTLIAFLSMRFYSYYKPFISPYQDVLADYTQVSSPFGSEISSTARRRPAAW